VSSIPHVYKVPRSGRWLGCTLVVLAGVCVQSAQADVVHFENGRSMEGVVLEETADQIRLRVPFGEIGLPRSSVSRVERADSAFELYLARRAELEASDAEASDWLALARWAVDEGLDHSARESVLFAAELNPELDELVPLMRRFDYALDESLGEWVPWKELMRRRGYVLTNGKWLSPSEAMARRRAEDEAAASRRNQERQDRLTRAMEMMVLAQVIQAEEDRRLMQEAQVVGNGIPIWGYPIGPPHGYWPRPPLQPGPQPPRPPHRPEIEGPKPTPPPVRTHYGRVQKVSDSQ